MGELVGHWGTTAAAELEGEYDRLLSKYQRAVLCGRKYEWNRARCVKELGHVEAELSTKGVADDQQAAAAVDMVVASIKAEKAAAIKALKNEMQTEQAKATAK